jgi:hypothetical protein
VARAASLADATPYAGVVGGGISATSTPTTTQATALWDDAATQANLALVGASLSITQTVGTVAYAMALEIERLLTSAKVLRARQPIGPDATDHPADALEAQARDTADRLRTSAAALVAAGQATALDADGAEAWSYLVDGQAPGTNLTPGQDVPYATPRPPSPSSRW